MIVPINGKVAYPITLDPTVWIFDDRKIELEKAFTEKPVDTNDQDELERASQRWSQEVYQQNIKPPVNRSIKKYEREKILESSYVMPIGHFLDNAEISKDASGAILVTDSKEIPISIDDLYHSYFLFARDGKPLKEDGPVHLYYQDGSNKDNPIKHITAIKIK